MSESAFLLFAFTMLLRGTLVHTPRLGDLEILDDHLIGLKYVREIEASSLL